MIAVVILIVLVTVLSVYSAFGTYQNTQDIKALTDITKVIGINAKHIYQIHEMLKEQEAKTGYWIDSAGCDKCSICGAEYSDLYPDYSNTHFCPNCGAKMDIKNEVTAMEEQTIPFEILVHPNEEQLKKRNAFMSSMEENITIVKVDSDGIVAEMVVKE